MLDFIKRNLTKKEVKDLIVSPTVEDGWLSDYIPKIEPYLPNVNGYVSKVNEYVPYVTKYVPSTTDAWNKCKSLIVSEEKTKDVSIILKVPGWFMGNATYAMNVCGVLYKTWTGAAGFYFSSDRAFKAAKCKDKLCFTMSCAALCLDVYKMGSNLLPYQYNYSKYETINVGLKALTEVCKDNGIYEKTKVVVGWIRKIRGRFRR